MYTKEIAQNKKAFFEYEILEKFEVGIALLGTEVKSLRAQGGSLQESYVACEEKGLFLIGSSIPPYIHGNIHNHEERRKRQLLASKKEILQIKASIAEKGLTCVPLRLYLKGGLIKLEIALARGKKIHDKRKSIQERDDKRAIELALKQRL